MNEKDVVHTLHNRQPHRLRRYDELPMDVRAVTIVYQVDEVDPEGMAIVNAGVSFCSTEDNFSRKEGRSLAIERLNDHLDRYHCPLLQTNMRVPVTGPEWRGFDERVTALVIDDILDFIDLPF